MPKDNIKPKKRKLGEASDVLQVRKEKLPPRVHRQARSWNWWESDECHTVLDLDDY